MGKAVHIAVLGTGVPKDIISDSNYNYFLREVLYQIHASQSNKEHCVVYLCGGKTNINYPERSGAGEMRRWLEKALKNTTEEAITFVLIDDTLDARQNIEALAKIVIQNNVRLITIFVEYARQDTTRVLARHFLKRFQIVPVQYDFKRNAYWERVKRIPKVLLMWGALRSKSLRALEIQLRKHFIERWGRTTDQKP